MENQHTHTDELILSLLDADDERAVTMLDTVYSELIYHTASKIVGDTVAASEIAQDLYINIWEKRHSLHLKKPLKPYLIKAITHRCLNYLRNRKTRRKTLIVDQSVLEMLSIDADADGNLNAHDIEHLIRKTKTLLSPRTRIAFILNRSFSMSYKEISTYMGISQKGVEKHISKALVIFRKVLSEYLKSLMSVLP